MDVIQRRDACSTGYECASLTSGGRSVGIVRLRTTSHGV
jgi:hypothetical protein